MSSSSSSRAAAGPILALYRSIMREHRSKLAGPLRSLGDDYTRSEFRAHLRGKTTEGQWKMFVEQWQRYLSFIEGTADDKTAPFDSKGELREEVVSSMSPDQRRRMELLKEEARRVDGGEGDGGGVKGEDGRRGGGVGG